MHKRVILIFMIFAIQGCTALFRQDYFAPSSVSAKYFDHDCYSYLGKLYGGVDFKFGGPGTVANISYNNSIFSVCSITTENNQMISVGPILPIIPIPISSDASNYDLIIGVKHISHSDILSVDTSNAILVSESGNKLILKKHEKDEQSCNYETYFRARDNRETTIPCVVHFFYYKREKLSELEYRFSLNALKLNDMPMPDINIIFNRERATYFALIGP